MKTITLLLTALLVLAACTPSEAADPRRDTEALTVAAYEAQAISRARQRPEVIKLRFTLAKATTQAERDGISSALYAIIESAASQGRQAGLAVVEARRRADAELHREWDEDRRHNDLIWSLNNINANLRR